MEPPLKNWQMHHSSSIWASRKVTQRQVSSRL